MTEVIEYKGKKWEVVAEPRDDMPTGKWLEVVPVPDLPEEPPVGTILVDDGYQVWQRVPSCPAPSVWVGSALGKHLTWNELLHWSGLRQVVVVGKATDSVVRFNGTDVEVNRVEDHRSDRKRGRSFADGFTDDEAPVHGYFKRLVD